MGLRSRQVWAIAVVAIGIGGGCLWLAAKANLPRFEPLGLLIASAAPLLVGLQAVATQRFSFDYEKYRGSSAIAIGVCLLALGVGMLAVGVTGLSGESLPEGLTEGHEGLIVAGIGVMLALYNYSQVAMNVVRGDGTKMAGWRLLPERMGAGFLCLVGLAMVGGGLLHEFWPAELTAIRDALVQAVFSLLS